MHDMLVRLYDLPSADEALAAMARHGIAVRRAIAPEAPAIVEWVRSRFASSVAEIETALRQVPATCLVATRADALLGFACYDVTCRNFFGPEGVDSNERGRGIG